MHDLCDNILYTLKYISIVAGTEGPAVSPARVCSYYVINSIHIIIIIYYVCMCANSDIIKLRTTTCRTRSGSNKFHVTPLEQFIGKYMYMYNIRVHKIL